MAPWGGVAPDTRESPLRGSEGAPRAFRQPSLSSRASAALAAQVGQTGVRGDDSLGWSRNHIGNGILAEQVWQIRGSTANSSGRGVVTSVAP